jgi:hypothetical protein
LKYEMYKTLAFSLIEAYENNYVIGERLPATIAIFRASDQRFISQIELPDFKRLEPLFEKHRNSTYGSIYPGCLQVSKLGYKYAKYWLAYWELEEAKADYN